MLGRLAAELAHESRDILERRAYKLLAEDEMFGEAVQRFWVSKPSQNSLYSTETFEDVYKKKHFRSQKLGFLSLGKFSKAVYADKLQPLLGFSVKGLNMADQNLLREIIAGWFGDIRDNLREMYGVKGSHMRRVDGEEKLFMSTEIMDERIGAKFQPTKEKPQNVISIGAMIRSFGADELQKQIRAWKKRRDEAMGVESKKRDAPCDPVPVPVAKKPVPPQPPSAPPPPPPPPPSPQPFPLLAALESLQFGSYPHLAANSALGRGFSKVVVPVDPSSNYFGKLVDLGLIEGVTGNATEALWQEVEKKHGPGFVRPTEVMHSPSESASMEAASMQAAIEEALPEDKKAHVAPPPSQPPVVVGQPVNDEKPGPSLGVDAMQVELASVSIRMAPEAVHVSVSVQQKPPSSSASKKKATTTPVAVKQRVQSIDSDSDDDDQLPAPVARVPVSRAPVARAPAPAASPAPAGIIDFAAITAKYTETKKKNREFPILCPHGFKLEYHTDHALGLLYYTQQRKAGSSAGGLDSYIDILKAGVIPALLLAKGIKNQKRLRSGKDVEKLAALLASKVLSCDCQSLSCVCRQLQQSFVVHMSMRCPDRDQG